jgi:tetratricopeptide (TPR) repeat protein
MNLHQFPDHSNNPKLIRREPSAASGSKQESSVRLPFGEALAVSKPSSGRSTQAKPSDPKLVYLSAADREALLRQQAIDQAQQGHLDEAIDLFTFLIHDHPDSASHYNNRGLLLFQQGRPDLALEDYHTALQLNPRLGKVYNNRANCWASLGNLEAAIADYETAINLDPTDIRARLNLGITFRELHLYDRALEAFELALQISQLLNSTELVGVPIALEGHIYAERGRLNHLLGDWNCAVADYHRALERLPLNGNATDSSYRLRFQVQEWLNALLSPYGSEP